MRTVPLIAVFVFTATMVGAQTPESPAIWREVLGVNGYSPETPTFTRPHMPGLRVTKDGRVGVLVEGQSTLGIEAQTTGFALMKPEKLVEPFLLSSPGAYTMSSVNFTYLDNNKDYWYLSSQFAPGSERLTHACLWDDHPPTTILGNDVYDLKVLATATTGTRTRLHVTPLRITVASPKTALASIVSVERTGPTVSSPLLPYYSFGFEPMICGDGRLLVLRIANFSGVQWTDPNTQASRQNAADIVYAYYPSGATVDPTKWTNMIPISFAPYDQRINDKFGFAMAPFRDAQGNLIPPGEDIGGSYPWIDRGAKNLFLETIGERSKFYYASGPTPLPSRYPAVPLLNDPSYVPAEDTGGKHQGVAILGLWSGGKLVMIDNLNNDIDYAMGNSNTPQTRDVLLFDSSRDPEPAHAWLRMGYGRATLRMPAGENENGNIIDSLEARFGYRNHFKPIRLNDVVWPVTNGKHTDELGFDDYIDPDAFLVVNMVGALEFVDSAANSLRRYEYHDGWQHPNGPFNKPIRLQNAANGLAWNVPAYGQSEGSSRLEPAATGGIDGKGFWLTGQNGVVFPVPAQNPPQKVYDADWFVGVFVDCRHDDDTIERSVLTFPDGTSLRLYGLDQVVYADATGAAVHRVTMPDGSPSLLPYRGWAHLGLQIREGGSQVDFHLNGLLYDRWRDPGRSLFQLPAGSLTLGKVQSSSTNGINGWVDELKIFAHTFDPETVCNHAGGTLIGLDPAYVGPWRLEFADRFPAWVHAEISAELRNRGEPAYPAYACFHQYDRDHGVHLGNIPALTHSLRASMQFPEGPLFHNAPRPQSLHNSFCASCHYPGGKLGLGLSALTLNANLTAAEDPRRQPMQPAARIHGSIPAGLVDTVTPPQPMVSQVAPPGGLPIDAWMLPTYNGPAVVQSFTVVDPATGDDLCELTPGMALDPMILGVTSVSIRANLDSAQGSVTHWWNMQQAPATLVPPHVQPVTLTPGNHMVSARPAAGVLVSRTFTVPAPGVRVIANYRTALQAGSPAANWSYAWNDDGDVTSLAPYRGLNWSPTYQRYTGHGVLLPDNTSLAFGQFASWGGHTGQGPSQQSNGPERFVLAGYEVRAAGTFRVQAGAVHIADARSDGGRVVVLVRGANSVQVHLDQTFVAGTPFSIPMQRMTGLTPGQIIYVGIGPNGNAYYDTFSLDFDIAVE